MIWIIGTGLMGIEYAKVLNAIGVEYTAIGRGELSASAFEKQTGHQAIRGGLTAYLATRPAVPQQAIVAVGIEALTDTCIELLGYGVKHILQEKPGIGWMSEIRRLDEAVNRAGADVVLAYNRRFYSSVLAAEKIIAEDGGVSSFNFEFTEWSHTIAPLPKTKVEHQTWFMGNSSHVIDTAFFLGGQPKELTAYHGGENVLTWHPSGSKYAGAGITNNGALFSYQGNWTAPGRWVIEMLTRKHRLYFKPMETLQIQEIGSVAVNPVEIDNRLDVDFKPGFYLQTQAFLAGDYTRFCTVAQQKEHIERYYKAMSGYTD
ncbi:gfo/Idh/MocA family oxidoreductase [uncultured Rikenella sp.]|uniref:gfo/Idh/MocA family oxidoreductase n=1 Tax=uncultured Rikenella sp. TaxID=368003 RepID=UPI00261DADC0|nr:gfo/Idh/MocA family oxidoreductase [uncultured Rikenella sp.]